MTSSRCIYRIMAEAKSIYAEECYKGGFIGAGWLEDVDLTVKLPENWRDFNREMIPIFLEKNPDKSKVSAGLACGMLHTICKGMLVGDLVLCPNGKGAYYAGEVISEYRYEPKGILPHRRDVKWYPKSIAREGMSEGLRNSTGSAGTVSNISKHAAEIESLLTGIVPPVLVARDPDVEDPAVFALEAHLEDFLVKNWTATELGKNFSIYEEDGETLGQQYPTDTGSIDILAVSKDRKTLLVIELKKGRASDVVVGQTLRYMGYVQEELAEPGQSVRGVIIALEDDPRLKRAIAIVPSIEFYKYTVSFKLMKG